jgi:hypothetical protein
MTIAKRPAPWIFAALACVVAILVRQFLIQPPDVAQQCNDATLTLWSAGPWWCSFRAAAVMTYAWRGLFYASFALSLATLLWRRVWLATATLTVGLVAIVWYTYEPGAVAITIGALVLARRQHDTVGVTT